MPPPKEVHSRDILVTLETYFSNAYLHDEFSGKLNWNPSIKKRELAST